MTNSILYFQPWYIRRCIGNYPMFWVNPICWIFAKLFYNRWAEKMTKRCIAYSNWLNSMTAGYIEHLEDSKSKGVNPMSVEEFVYVNNHQ